MNDIDRLATVLPSLSSLVDRLWHGQLEHPVPNGGTVHQTLDRIIVMGTTYACWLRGRPATDCTAPMVYGWVPAAEFREVMDDLLAALGEPGMAEATLHTPMGTMTGAEVAHVILVGIVINGRALATATDRPFDVPPAVMAAVDPFAATGV